MACILVIEDDPFVLRALEFTLRHDGHRVLRSVDGAGGLRLAREEKPELAILDVGLPDQSGFDVCRELRSLPNELAVLMLTERVSVEDRVRGLDSGADDYLPKPFDERELIARVHALLRRQQRTAGPARTLTLGDVEIRFAEHSAVRAGKPLALTKSEFALLELLASASGKPVSRNTILDLVLGYSQTTETRAADTLVWRLRKKLGDSGAQPRWIKHVPGGGYVLDVRTEETAP